MGNLQLSSVVKVPRVHGEFTAQKLILEDGDWVVESEQEGTNVFLDQAMATLFGVGGDDLSYALLFNSIHASDDGTATSASTTAKAGTIYSAPATVSNDVSDAGTIGAREYTKYTKEVVFYQSSGMVDGSVFRKIYGVASPYFGLPDNLISEILLPTPVTISDINKEALKVTYSIYFPRFGLAAENKHGREAVGSGSLNIQERDASDVITTGPTVNWTMYVDGHKGGGSSTSGFRHDYFCYLGASTAGTYSGLITDASSESSSGRPATLVSGPTKTQPTATSVKIASRIRVDPFGNVGSNYSCEGLGLDISHPSYSSPYKGNGQTWFVEFSAPITLEWTQALEIEAEVTFDWS